MPTPEQRDLLSLGQTVRQDHAPSIADLREVDTRAGQAALPFARSQFQAIQAPEDPELRADAERYAQKIFADIGESIDSNSPQYRTVLGRLRRAQAEADRTITDPAKLRAVRHLLNPSFDNVQNLAMMTGRHFTHDTGVRFDRGIDAVARASEQANPLGLVGSGLVAPALGLTGAAVNLVSPRAAEALSQWAESAQQWGPNFAGALERSVYGENRLFSAPDTEMRQLQQETQGRVWGLAGGDVGSLIPSLLPTGAAGRIASSAAAARGLTGEAADRFVRRSIVSTAFGQSAGMTFNETGSSVDALTAGAITALTVRIFIAYGPERASQAHRLLKDMNPEQIARLFTVRGAAREMGLNIAHEALEEFTDETLRSLIVHQRPLAEALAEGWHGFMLGALGGGLAGSTVLTDAGLKLRRARRDQRAGERAQAAIQEEATRRAAQHVETMEVMEERAGGDDFVTPDPEPTVEEALDDAPTPLRPVDYMTPNTGSPGGRTAIGDAAFGRFDDSERGGSPVGATLEPGASYLGPQGQDARVLSVNRDPDTQQVTGYQVLMDGQATVLTPAQVEQGALTPRTVGTDPDLDAQGLVGEDGIVERDAAFDRVQGIDPDAVRDQAEIQELRGEPAEAARLREQADQLEQVRPDTRQTPEQEAQGNEARTRAHLTQRLGATESQTLVPTDAQRTAPAVGARIIQAADGVLARGQQRFKVQEFRDLFPELPTRVREQLLRWAQQQGLVNKKGQTGGETRTRGLHNLAGRDSFPVQSLAEAIEKMGAHDALMGLVPESERRSAEMEELAQDLRGIGDIIRELSQARAARRGAEDMLNKPFADEVQTIEREVRSRLEFLERLNWEAFSPAQQQRFRDEVADLRRRAEAAQAQEPAAQVSARESGRPDTSRPVSPEVRKEQREIEKLRRVRERETQKAREKHKRQQQKREARIAQQHTNDAHAQRKRIAREEAAESAGRRKALKLPASVAKLPARDPARPTMAYAGIGSRETPPRVQNIMRAIAGALERAGYLLRTGDAKGADAAFRSGTRKSQVFGPKDARTETRMIAMETHPAGERLMGRALDLHARNTNQVFGEKLDTPADFVIAWTPTDGRSSGTDQAIRLARAKGIPVINLNADMWARADRAFVEQFAADLAAGNLQPYVDTRPAAPSTEAREVARMTALEGEAPAWVAEIRQKENARRELRSIRPSRRTKEQNERLEQLNREILAFVQRRRKAQPALQSELDNIIARFEVVRQQIVDDPANAAAVKEAENLAARLRQLAPAGVSFFPAWGRWAYHTLRRYSNTKGTMTPESAQRFAEIIETLTRELDGPDTLERARAGERRVRRLEKQGKAEEAARVQEEIAQDVAIAELVDALEPLRRDLPDDADAPPGPGGRQINRYKDALNEVLFDLRNRGAESIFVEELAPGDPSAGYTLAFKMLPHHFPWGEARTRLTPLTFDPEKMLAAAAERQLNPREVLPDLYGGVPGESVVPAQGSPRSVPIIERAEGVGPEISLQSLSPAQDTPRQGREPTGEELAEAQQDAIHQESLLRQVLFLDDGVVDGPAETREMTAQDEANALKELVTQVQEFLASPRRYWKKKRERETSGAPMRRRAALLKGVVILHPQRAQTGRETPEGQALAKVAAQAGVDLAQRSRVEMEIVPAEAVNPAFAQSTIKIPWESELTPEQRGPDAPAREFVVVPRYYIGKMEEGDQYLYLPLERRSDGTYTPIGQNDLGQILRSATKFSEAVKAVKTQDSVRESRIGAMFGIPREDLRIPSLVQAHVISRVGFTRITEAVEFLERAQTELPDVRGQSKQTDALNLSEDQQAAGLAGVRDQAERAVRGAVMRKLQKLREKANGGDILAQIVMTFTQSRVEGELVQLFGSDPIFSDAEVRKWDSRKFTDIKSDAVIEELLQDARAALMMMMSFRDAGGADSANARLLLNHLRPGRPDEDSGVYLGELTREAIEFAATPKNQQYIDTELAKYAEGLMVSDYDLNAPSLDSRLGRLHKHFLMGRDPATPSRRERYIMNMAEKAFGVRIVYDDRGGSYKELHGQISEDGTMWINPRLFGSEALFLGNIAHELFHHSVRKSLTGSPSARNEWRALIGQVLAQSPQGARAMQHLMETTYEGRGPLIVAEEALAHEISRLAFSQAHVLEALIIGRPKLGQRILLAMDSLITAGNQFVAGIQRMIGAAMRTRRDTINDAILRELEAVAQSARRSFSYLGMNARDFRAAFEAGRTSLGGDRTQATELFNTFTRLVAGNMNPAEQVRKLVNEPSDADGYLAQTFDGEGYTEQQLKHFETRRSIVTSLTSYITQAQAALGGLAAYTPDARKQHTGDIGKLLDRVEQAQSALIRVMRTIPSGIRGMLLTKEELAGVLGDRHLDLQNRLPISGGTRAVDVWPEGGAISAAEKTLRAYYPEVAGDASYDGARTVFDRMAEDGLRGARDRINPKTLPKWMRTAVSEMRRALQWFTREESLQGLSLRNPEHARAALLARSMSQTKAHAMTTARMRVSQVFGDILGNPNYSAARRRELMSLVNTQATLEALLSRTEQALSGQQGQMTAVPMFDSSMTPEQQVRKLRELVQEGRDILARTENLPARQALENLVMLVHETVTLPLLERGMLPAEARKAAEDGLIWLHEEVLEQLADDRLAKVSPDMTFSAFSTSILAQRSFQDRFHNVAIDERLLQSLSLGYELVTFSEHMGRILRFDRGQQIKDGFMVRNHNEYLRDLDKAKISGDVSDVARMWSRVAEDLYGPGVSHSHMPEAFVKKNRALFEILRNLHIETGSAEGVRARLLEAGPEVHALMLEAADIGTAEAAFANFMREGLLGMERFTRYWDPKSLNQKINALRQDPADEMHWIVKDLVAFALPPVMSRFATLDSNYQQMLERTGTVEVGKRGVAEIEFESQGPLLYLDPAIAQVLSRAIAPTMDLIRTALRAGAPPQKSALRRGVRAAWTAMSRWTLQNPVALATYYWMNVSTNSTLLASTNPGALTPRTMGTAFELLSAHLTDGGATLSAHKRRLLNEMSRYGVVNAGFLRMFDDVARSDIRDLAKAMGRQGTEFSWTKMIKLLGPNVLTGYGASLVDDTFKVAAFLHAVEQAQTHGIEALARTSAVTHASLIRNASNVYEAAAAKARGDLGDFGDLSPAGKFAKQYVMPYYPWLEVSTRIFVRMLAAPFRGGAGLTGAERARAAAKVSAVIFAGQAAFSALVWAINRAVMDDDDREEARRAGFNPYAQLFMGFREDASGVRRMWSMPVPILYIDVLRNAGLDNTPELRKQVMEVVHGQRRVASMAGEAAENFASTLSSLVGPIINVGVLAASPLFTKGQPYAFGGGRPLLYPVDSARDALLRLSGVRVAQSVLGDQPTADLTLNQFIIGGFTPLRPSDPEYTRYALALSDIHNAFRVMDASAARPQHLVPPARTESSIMANHVLRALRNNDESELRRTLRRYFAHSTDYKEDFTPENILNSLQNNVLLGRLSQADQRALRDTMGEEAWARVVAADGWSRELFSLTRNPLLSRVLIEEADNHSRFYGAMARAQHAAELERDVERAREILLERGEYDQAVKTQELARAIRAQAQGARHEVSRQVLLRMRRLADTVAQTNFRTDVRQQELEEIINRYLPEQPPAPTADGPSRRVRGAPTPEMQGRQGRMLPVEAPAQP